MSKFYSRLLAAIAVPMILSGCVDDNYDLSDIDTTTRIPVNNLIVPLNVSDILLDDVIDLSDNENISEFMIDGHKAYAIEKSGTISTDPISIDPVHINAPSISSNSINLNASQRASIKGRRIPNIDDLAVNYNIESTMLSSFSFETVDIDDALIAVKNLKAASDIVMTLSFTLPQDLASDVNKVTFSNVALDLPKGLLLADGSPARLDLGTYNPRTGVGVLDGAYTTNGNRTVNISLRAEQLDAEMAGIDIVNHTINYSGDAGLAGTGSILLTPRLDDIRLADNFTLVGDYHITSFDVKSVSGTVDYEAEGIDINPIDLSDLPDFLADPETDIRLVNPQIYLGAVNTTAPYHTGIEGAVCLESIFGTGSNTTQRTETSPTFGIGYDHGVTTYNIALAADPSSLNLLNDFPNPMKYTFAGLGNILSDPAKAAGLPKTVHISLPSLRFFGDAVDFPITQPGNSNEGKIDGITGNYRFFAPLALQENSLIVYAKTEDDISTEDLDKLTINKVNLSAIATTNIPFSLRLSIAVFGKDGRQLGTSTETMVVNPNSTAPIQLGVASTPDNPIREISSLQYRAEILGGADKRPLSPEQFIRLSNIRVTVDGYYETDF